MIINSSQTKLNYFYFLFFLTAAAETLLFVFTGCLVSDAKIDGMCLRTTSQVVESGLQTFAPPVEVHRGQRFCGGGLEPQLHAL